MLAAAAFALALIMATTQDAAPPAAPAAPAAQTPSSPWRVDYGEQRCVAVRNFGAGQEMMSLVLQRGANPAMLTIGIAGQSIVTQPDNPQFIVDIGSEVAAGPQGGRAATAPDGRQVLFIERPLDNAVARLRGAQSLRFVPARGNAHVLRLNGIGAVLDRLEHCHQDLLGRLGFDAAAMRTLRSPPVPIEPERWISTALLPGFSGQAHGAILLNVSAEGRVTACRTLDSSGLQHVDDNICRQMMRRARFRPAIGPEGTPVAAQVIRGVRYQTSQ
jgi:hypothetical protein